MLQLTELVEGSEIGGTSISAAPFEHDLWLDKPDAHWVANSGSGLSGAISVWWRNVPQLPPHRVGLIGHYRAADDLSADTLLEYACRQLKNRGCTIAVGPMDGNTWGNYRFVTECGDEPRFWLEPSNPLEWPAQFVQRGFEPLAHYFSAVTSEPNRRDPRLAGLAEQWKQNGITIRTMNEDAFEDDSRKILGVTRIAFANNLLYSQVAESDFLDQCRRLNQVAPLDLIWIAERNSTPVGFIFAVPDLLEVARLGNSCTAIVKTLAVLPDRSHAGLGQVLLERVQRRASELGYSRVIHALVRDLPHLRRISARYAHSFRQYTLYARML